jgi:UDP-2,4-diacetamido-2,4,6-trideoxy-beta-L-altropyranose hydrolase
VEELLLIRADADELIGAGHVMRCLALAQAWRDADRGPVWLASRTLPVGLRDRYQREGVRVCMIEAGLSAFSQVLGDAHPRWVVLDGYAFGREEQQAVRRARSGLLVVDDDGAMGAYAAHVVVDPNVFAEARAYAGRGATERLLLGPSYALIRKEIRNSKVSKPIEKNAKKLLVTFGGADRERLSSTAIRALENVNVQVTLALGPANTHVEEVNSVAAAGANVRVVRDPDNMRELMDGIDLALVAAGGICLELAHAGVPQVVVSTSDNQKRVAKGLVDRGVARSLGDAASVQAGDIRDSVVSLLRDPEARSEMRARGMALVDGRGVERILSAMVGFDS